MNADAYLLKERRPLDSRHSGRGKLGAVVDALTFLYVMSFYTLVNNPELSKVSYIVSALLCFAVVAFKLSMHKISLPRGFWIPWIFVWYNVCSVFWARDTVSGLWEAGSIASAVLGATMIWLALESGQSPHVLTMAMVAGSIALVIYSYDEIQHISEVERVGSIVGNANRMAMYLSYCFLTIWCIPDKVAKKLRWVGVLFLFFALAYSGSKKLLVVLVALLVFLLLDLITKKQKDQSRATFAIMTLSSSLIGIILLSVYFNVGSWQGIQSNKVIARTQDFLNGGRASDRDRKAMATEATELWLANPVLGLGTGQYAERGSFDTYSHNNYTELLANLGVIGLLLYYALPFGLLVGCARSGRHMALRWHLLTAICVILVLDVGMVSVISKANWTLLALLSYRVGSGAPNEVLPLRHHSLLQPSYTVHNHLFQ